MKRLTKDRFCGNCRYHNSYNYPDESFCFLKFQKHENAVVSTMDKCDLWKSKPQECHCLGDTLNKKEKKLK